MKSVLGILVILLLASAGASRADECGNLFSEPERYGSAPAQLAALKSTMNCAVQNIGAALALLKIRLEVEEALRKEPRNEALADIRRKIDASELDYSALALKFHTRAKKIEADMLSNSITTPEGVYRRLPHDRTM